MNVLSPRVEGAIETLYRDLDADAGVPWMRFRLTYDGKLYGPNSKGAASHKHEIRKVFHPQLRRLWEVTPSLENLPANTIGGRGWTGGYAGPEAMRPIERRIDWLPGEYSCGKFQFVPLVTQELDLSCGISILYLRPEAPGGLIRSGDIDGRLKTLFDALRLPNQTSELGGHEPTQDERPMFCLLADDRLVSSVTLDADTLLTVGGQRPDPNDARILITVDIRRTRSTWLNGAFE